MGVPEYLSKGVRIRATSRPSRKCELMKLFVPLVSSMYADAAYTVAAPKFRNSLPDDLRTVMSSRVTFKFRHYSHMLSLQCILFKYIIRLFIYLCVLLYQLDAYKCLHFSLSQ